MCVCRCFIKLYSWLCGRRDRVDDGPFRSIVWGAEAIPLPGRVATSGILPIPPIPPPETTFAQENVICQWSENPAMPCPQLFGLTRLPCPSEFNNTIAHMWIISFVRTHVCARSLPPFLSVSLSLPSSFFIKKYVSCNLPKWEQPLPRPTNSPPRMRVSVQEGGGLLSKPLLLYPRFKGRKQGTGAKSVDPQSRVASSLGLPSHGMWCPQKSAPPK